MVKKNVSNVSNVFNTMLKMIGGENELNNESYQERKMGENPVPNSIIQHFQTFITIVMVGYFGVKIVYALFFNIYPSKFYQKHIEINHDSEDKNAVDKITLNAYVPGVWNNEITDFISLLVLCYVIYIYTNVSSKNLINEYGNLNLSFLFGYIIGLGYPVFYSNYIELYNKQQKTSILFKYLYLIALLTFIMFIIIMNYTSANKISSIHSINYMVYISTISLLFGGLIIAKKNINSYNSVTYFYNNGQQCSYAKNGVFQSSGDIINITIPFLVFIILLFFSYEPTEITMKLLYIFVYGLLLGILVSGISYYGIEYFLYKQPEKECKDLNECILKNMPTPIPEEQISYESIIKPENIDPNIKKNINNQLNPLNNVSTMKIALIIIIVLISIYLIYFYLFK